LIPQQAGKVLMIHQRTTVLPEAGFTVYNGQWPWSWETGLWSD